MSTLAIILIVAGVIVVGLIAYAALRRPATEKRRARAHEMRDRAQISRAQAEKERATADEQEARARREAAEADERARSAERKRAEADRQAERAESIDPDRKRGGLFRGRRRERDEPSEPDDVVERR
jgi:flagellar biosynthesis/type III secretory pathway M-ring protein FliF/YscJ